MVGNRRGRELDSMPQLLEKPGNWGADYGLPAITPRV